MATPISRSFTTASSTAIYTHLNDIISDINAKLVEVTADYAAGWAVKTNGFQGSLSDVAVTVVQGGLSGGMTWSAANGGGLVVPAAGTYSVHGYAYFSGPPSTIFAQVLRWRAGVATSVVRTPPLTKDNVEDWPLSFGGPVECLAGDIFTLQARASTCSVWGDSAKTGTRLSVRRLL